MVQGISAFILAAFGAAIMFMERVADAVAGLMDVLASVRALFSAFFEAPIVILSETSRYVAYTLTAGEWAFFGPLTLPVGVASIAIAFWVWAVFDPPLPLPGFVGRLVNRDEDD